MAFSTYLINALLGHSSGDTSYTMPTVYVGLSSTTPTAAGGNVTEPSTGSYARQATSGATWNTAASGAQTNAAAITFPPCTADYLSGANITYVVFFDHLTNSTNVLEYIALTTAKAFLNGDQATFPVTSISRTIT